MLFNSFQFILFYIIVLILYYKVNHKFRWILLLLSSCIFYMYFKAIYILILLFTIVIDYFAGILLETTSSKYKKMVLLLSLIANIGILVFYKYFNFFNENLGYIFHYFKIDYSISNLSFLLPIGLSFHTFQAMSYTIEIYRGKQKAERHFGIYALYVLFWPQLVAGPIERPQNILHQFHLPKFFQLSNFKIGIRMILWGLFKKVVIADSIASIIRSNYNVDIVESSELTNVISMYLFSIQIYCDFSGYSDIALGSAKTMGFDLMKNFNNPYFSKNISEFWRRWHISLSTWFKDYLYIPLGGSKSGFFKLSRNLFIVFLVSGFWHGASWNFIIWGAIHGMFQIIYLLFKRYIPSSKLTSSKLASIFSVIFTFHLVSIAWIFFRAENFESSITILKSILHFFLSNNLASFPILFDGIFTSLHPLLILSLLFMFVYEYYVNLSVVQNSTVKLYIEMLFLTMLIILMGTSIQEDFIYFQF